MKERPIIFNAEMVNAILSGRKTQTRRIVKPVKGYEHHNICRPDLAAAKNEVWWHSESESFGVMQSCPFGEVGERLWVRETFAAFDADWKHPGKPHDLKDGPWPNVVYPASVAKIPDGTCRQSIHMPRWASRITLEITGVRVERLNSISDADMRTEGMRWKEEFPCLWESIYGEESWQANPFVWCISFKRV